MYIRVYRFAGNSIVAIIHVRDHVEYCRRVGIGQQDIARRLHQNATEGIHERTGKTESKRYGRATSGTVLKTIPERFARCQTGESIYEYTISVTGEWQHWGTLVDEYVYPADYIPVYGDILVPNLDNVRTMYLITLIAAQEKNVLLIGEQGTAKTVMIKSYMQDFNPETRLSKMLNFSSATTPNMFQVRRFFRLLSTVKFST